MPNPTLLEWKEDISPNEWDTLLTSLQGHFLQSAQWGTAKRSVNGIKDHRWAAFKNGEPIFLVRFEERKLLKIFKIAWIPRGPTIHQDHNEATLKKEFFRRLRKKGFFFFIATPWKKVFIPKKNNLLTHTIWVNLNLTLEKLWQNLDKQFRYGVRRAKKSGVTVEKTEAPDDIHRFFQLCEYVGKRKGFSLNTSEKLMLHLAKNPAGQQVEFHLFVTRYEKNICSGAFIARCGDSIHYVWGAVDRAFSKLNTGEAIQWGVIEWAVKQNCKLYDLEGVCPHESDGTYQFKKKLGGELIALPGTEFYSPNIFFQQIVNVLRNKNFLKI